MKKSTRTSIVVLSLTLFVSCANQFKSEREPGNYHTNEFVVDVAESYWPFSEILEKSDPYVSELL